MIIIKQNNGSKAFLNGECIASMHHDIEKKEVSVVFTNWTSSRYLNVKEIIFD
jgi:hypothetical protein